MTQTSRPWQGRISEGALGDAGAYSSTQWQQVWESMFGQNQANRGILKDVEDELEVVASAPADTNVNVSAGAATVQGIWYYNNASVAVPIAANASGSTRIDVIVLEADYVAQSVRIDVVQGTPAAGVPALTQSAGTIWQIPLAYITLASGFVSISDSNITDWREYANIPSAVGIDIINGSGSTLETGSAVIWHASTALNINTTALQGNSNIAGVLERRTLNAAAGRVITQGIYPIICDEAVVIGALLELSTTAGQAQASVRNGIFARVLVANTGAGTKCLAYINVPIVPTAIVTGTYAGNNAATQAITGLGFQPRAVMVYSQRASGATQGATYLKTDRDGSTNAQTLIVRNVGLGAQYAVYSNDAIRSLDSDGFTVGDTTDESANQTNATGITYTFVAWR